MSTTHYFFLHFH